MARTPALPHPAATPMLELYYSPEQIAQAVGLTKETILLAIKRGDIKDAVKPFENVVRVPASAVNDWLRRATIQRAEQRRAKAA